MNKANNSNATPSKDTRAKNNNSDNDVDYKNNSIENSRSKSTSNKRPSSGNIRSV